MKKKLVWCMGLILLLSALSLVAAEKPSDKKSLSASEGLVKIGEGFIDDDWAALRLYLLTEENLEEYLTLEMKNYLLQNLRWRISRFYENEGGKTQGYPNFETILSDIVHLLLKKDDEQFTVHRIVLNWYKDETHEIKGYIREGGFNDMRSLLTDIPDDKLQNAIIDYEILLVMQKKLEEEVLEKQKLEKQKLEKQKLENILNVPKRELSYETLRSIIDSLSKLEKNTLSDDLINTLLLKLLATLKVLDEEESLKKEKEDVLFEIVLLLLKDHNKSLAIYTRVFNWSRKENLKVKNFVKELAEDDEKLNEFIMSGGRSSSASGSRGQSAASVDSPTGKSAPTGSPRLSSSGINSAPPGIGIIIKPRTLLDQGARVQSSSLVALPQKLSGPSRFRLVDFADRIKQLFFPSQEAVKGEAVIRIKDDKEQNKEYRKWFCALSLSDPLRDQAINEWIRRHTIPPFIVSLVQKMNDLGTKEACPSDATPGSTCFYVYGCCCNVSNDQTIEAGRLEITISSDKICYHLFLRPLDKVSVAIEDTPMRSLLNVDSVIHSYKESAYYTMKGEVAGFPSSSYQIDDETCTIKIWIPGSSYYYIFWKNESCQPKK